jgi:hypothetical protein
MQDEQHLTVYQDRSLLHQPGLDDQVFHEGPQSPQAKQRYTTIKAAFDNGFLENLITEIKGSPASQPTLEPDLLHLLEELVESVSSEKGRAIVALSLMQACIKAICPEQSIRLHKGDTRHGGDRFSWKEGLSMRSLDNNYVTPVLRKHDLIRLNADGFMMTRSLAENYPYSALYKAALRGGRSQWLSLTDLLETGKADAKAVLRTLVSLLLNRTAAFQELATAVVILAGEKATGLNSIDQVVGFFRSFVDKSAYSARIFEIAMHALYQALEESKHLPNFLKPLSQMRSANKKHGNIGDIELVATRKSQSIVESWDAKYGKPYLRDELEELHEKLQSHQETKIAGFVVDTTPNLKDEIERRRKELEELHVVTIHILAFPDWVRFTLSRFNVPDPVQIARLWFLFFVESLCQKRREKAPIDEPCDLWVAELKAALEAM